MLALSPTYTISAGDIELVAIDYTDHLDATETLMGTPTVALVGTGTLVIASVALNSTVKTILDRAVAVNCAVTFKISGQTAGVTYTIRVTVSTTSSPARTIVRDVCVRTN